MATRRVPDEEGGDGEPVLQCPSCGHDNHPSCSKCGHSLRTPTVRQVRYWTLLHVQVSVKEASKAANAEQRHRDFNATGRSRTESERTAADPTTATPRHNFAFTPSSAGDTQTPWITAMVSTQHGRLVMADYNNSKVKVCDLTDPYSLFASRQLEVPPFGLALLSDGLVAVTTGTKTIYLLGVGENRVSVKSRLETERVYVGVAGNSDDTLVVSCGEDGGRPSRVDVITRRGHVVRTVIDGRNLSGLEVPDYLCVADGQVWISDFWAYTVHKVELTTGRAECSQTHTYMKNPRQVAVDRLVGKASGSVYVASYGGQCVMARTGKGEWRRLLHGPRHSLRGYDIPCGVCSTDRGLVVAWCNEALISDSVVIGYDIAADMGDTP